MAIMEGDDAEDTNPEERSLQPYMEARLEKTVLMKMRKILKLRLVLARPGPGRLRQARHRYWRYTLRSTKLATK